MPEGGVSSESALVMRGCLRNPRLNKLRGPEGAKAWDGAALKSKDYFNTWPAPLQVAPLPLPHTTLDYSPFAPSRSAVPARALQTQNELLLLLLLLTMLLLLLLLILRSPWRTLVPRGKSPSRLSGASRSSCATSSSTRRSCPSGRLSFCRRATAS